MIVEDRRRWRALQTQFRGLWTQLEQSRTVLDQSSARIEQLKTAPQKASRRRRRA
jgi:hypothetical protein